MGAILLFPIFLLVVAIPLAATFFIGAVLSSVPETESVPSAPRETRPAKRIEPTRTTTARPRAQKRRRAASRSQSRARPALHGAAR